MTIAVMWRKSAGRPVVVLEILFRIVRQFWPELMVPELNGSDSSAVIGKQGVAAGGRSLAAVELSVRH